MTDPKCYSRNYRVMINHLPKYLNRNDIKFILKKYGPFRISEFRYEEDCLSGDGYCVLTFRNFNRYEALIQRRYFQRKSLTGRDVFFEVEPMKSDDDSRTNTSFQKIEIAPNGLAQRTLFISGMSRKTSRKQFMDALKAARIYESVELFIFKVDKEGKATGDARVIFESPQITKKAIRYFPRRLNGRSLLVEFIPGADAYFELKLGKEMEMEKRKIQRKYKKLFKFPKTPQLEGWVSMLQDVYMKTSSKRSRRHDHCWRKKVHSKYRLNQVPSPTASETSLKPRSKKNEEEFMLGISRSTLDVERFSEYYHNYSPNRN